jgi:exopolysaccharide biosynthesis polyprenyl glycosylphosphotransferase
MTSIQERDRSGSSDYERRWRFRPLDPALRGAGTVARRAWEAQYVRGLVAGDALVASLASVLAYLGRFGGTSGEDRFPAASIWFGAVLPVAWVLAMLIARTYERRFLWLGAEEFRRVFNSAVLLLAAVGTVGWALKLEVARGFVVLAIPLATLLTLLHRYVRRSRLHRQRTRGNLQQTLLVVGHRPGVAALTEQIERTAYHGYRVVGCCLPSVQPPSRNEPADHVPVLGTFADVVDIVRLYEVDTVAVLPSPELDGAALRRLGWDLESTEADLLLAPAITEIAGPRVNIRPLCGLPLLHMERPELRGVRRVTKAVTDRAIAVTAVFLLLPALLAIALAVRVTSRGPVFFRQRRVGKDGRTFSMIKFRTMVDGAHSMLSAIDVDDGNGVLFKLRDDPRVTRVGRVLRRFSLDELPQLLNVLLGDMSLVGPRPPLPSEVERYGEDMRRRLLVKPGLTGLWQVSGRSDLSWDDSVRIDIRYVENWSLSFDFMIMWKTLGAVLRGSGAY